MAKRIFAKSVIVKREESVSPKSAIEEWSNEEHSICDYGCASSNPVEISLLFNCEFTRTIALL